MIATMRNSAQIRHRNRWLAIAKKAIATGEREALRSFDYNRTSMFDFKQYKEIVTSADQSTNQAVIKALDGLTPNIPVCSEEGADIDRRELCDTELAWVLDPIDGTTNYAARLPLWGISLALMRNGEPIVGVITIPNLKQRYHAIKGGGAWLGRHRLRVSKTKNIEESLGLLCYGYSTNEIRAGLASMNTFTKIARATRRLGAAVIEAAWVASGRADFSILYGPKPWDVGAGSLLVREAGGKTTNLVGDAWTPDDKNIILANANILPAVLKILKKK